MLHHVPQKFTQKHRRYSQKKKSFVVMSAAVGMSVWRGDCQLSTKRTVTDSNTPCPLPNNSELNILYPSICILKVILCTRT